MRSNLQIYTNPAGLRHDTGPGHPERIARLETILGLLKEQPFDALPVREVRDTDTEILRLAHPQRYIDDIADIAPETGFAAIRDDVVLSPGTWDAALSAAAAVCQAVDDVVAGNCARAFCAIRPPGHHAMRAEALGFCLFANVFIGARHAQEKHGIRRVAIIDFDVHHGNGSDALARDVEDIFVVSSQQMPLWPGTGNPQYDEPGKTLNIPLPPGSGSKEFRAAYEAQVFPALNEFKPELVLISAGFDAHQADPLANLNWTEDDYFWVTEKLRAIANEHAGGRLVSSLEGGYNIDALKVSVAAHLRALAA